MDERDKNDAPDLEGLKGRAYVVALRSVEHGIYLSKPTETERDTPNELEDTTAFSKRKRGTNI